MGNFQVQFDLPQRLMDGLASGNLERIGGIIRESETKRIIAWLRENTVVSGEGRLFPPNIRHVLSSSDVFRPNVSIAAATVVANLALFALTFASFIERLDELTQMLTALSQELRKEFWSDRDTRFRAALEMAEQAFSSTQSAFRQEMGTGALRSLLQSSLLFEQELTRITSVTPIAPSQVTEMSYRLSQLVMSEQAITKCFVLLSESELAKKRLNERLPAVAKFTKLLVQVLTEPSFLFYHASINVSDLGRLLMICEWHSSGIMRTPSFETVLRNLEKSRPYFWDSSAVEEEYSDIFQRLLRRPEVSFAQRVETLLSRLLQAEIAIENFMRLQGVELELHAEALLAPTPLAVQFSELGAVYALIAEDELT